jgi:hypothetical protein
MAMSEDLLKLCPVCHDELEYQGVGTKPNRGKFYFKAWCKCGYHRMERYEISGTRLLPQLKGGVDHADE